jgi:hypothetical protein
MHAWIAATVRWLQITLMRALMWNVVGLLVATGSLVVLVGWLYLLWWATVCLVKFGISIIA